MGKAIQNRGWLLPVAALCLAGLAGCNPAAKQDTGVEATAVVVVVRPTTVVQRPAGYAENSAVFIFADGAEQAAAVKVIPDNTPYLPEVPPVDDLPAWERFMPYPPKP